MVYAFIDRLSPLYVPTLLFYKICRCIWHRYSCISRGGNSILYLDYALFDISGRFSEACKLERKADPGGRP